MSDAMTLEAALSILVEVHTSEDLRVGFVIRSGAAPDCYSAPWISRNQYTNAWRVVREHLGLPSTPEAVQSAEKAAQRVVDNLP